MVKKPPKPLKQSTDDVAGRLMKAMAGDPAMARHFDKLRDVGELLAGLPEEPSRQPGDSRHDYHVKLYNAIEQRRPLTHQQWVKGKGFGATSLNDYLKGRWKGKVSEEEMVPRIEKAIRADAKKLRLTKTS